MSVNDVVKMTLLKPHRHNGKDYEKGDVISVLAAEAAWLNAQKVATVDETTPAADAVTAEAEAAAAAGTDAAKPAKPAKAKTGDK